MTQLIRATAVQAVEPMAAVTASALPLGGWVKPTMAAFVRSATAARADRAEPTLA